MYRDLVALVYGDDALYGAISAGSSWMLLDFINTISDGTEEGWIAACRERHD